MTEACRRYDFCGARLTVEAEDKNLADLFERSFATFIDGQDGGESAASFTLRLATAAWRRPDDLPLVWEGALPEGGDGRLFETEARCVLEVDGACLVDIEPGRRRASVMLAPGGGPRFMGSASMLLLDFALFAGGQHLVHAACLLRRATGAAILVFGRSGAGKTTTSIALARGGFAIMTDDASVFSFGAGGLRVWGLPRALKVHRKTAALMPWLAPLLGGTWTADEQGIPLRDIAAHLELTAPSPSRLEAVILLGSRSADGHRIEPLPKADALLEIAGDNVASYETGIARRAVALFGALGRALTAVPAYRLHAGPDLAQLPAFLEAALQETEPSR